MFILTTFSDLVQIPPHEFYKKDRDEIEDKINAKYANRIVQRVGLCISLYDLLTASDGLIGHGGTGNLNVNVTFRMIVFRPFKGEIITAVIKKCTPNGLEVSTQFFDDIYVPRRMLFEGTEYDEKEKAWVWRNEEAELWFDEGTIVNVRIEAEKWQDQTPQGPGAGSAGEGGTTQTDAAAAGRVPYSIEASIMESGLGGLDWW